jgi:hypothetical protein
MFYLGKTSKRRIRGISELLVFTIDRYLEISPIDITIPWMGGRRTAEEQNEIFLRKCSKCDGYKKESFHQSGDAFDAAAFKNGEMSNEKHNALKVAYYMLKSFDDLKENNDVPNNLYLHCGIFWGDKDLDNDGFLTEQDKIGWDARHFELRPYPQKGTFEIKLAA